MIKGKKLTLSHVKRTILSIFLYLFGLFPACFLLWQGIEGELGADPVNFFERSLGLWAFRFLILCLFLSPFSQQTGIKLIKYRRWAGLEAFFYGCFHFIAYFFFSAGGDCRSLIAQIIHYPFMILGILALGMLLPLALTSNKISMKILKKKWKKLHLLIFPAAFLAGIHFYLSFKLWEDISLFYDSLLVVLLFYRVIFLFQSRTKKRKNLP